ncbi:MAG TPA: DUF2207 domain-containing protein [Gemmatimonadaceae bacterium]|nr:DUF2207 domain-containing protein [Gemmatimonadaceae bacterium]
MRHRVVSQALAGLALGAALWLPRAVRAQDTGWTIPSFSANYTVNADRSIDVTERIVADFGALQKHGIYRDIPVRYAKVVRPGSSIRAGTVDVALTVLGVTDENGQKLHTSITRGSTLRIKIGDANRLVSGTQTYVIHYRLGSGLGFFADHDELYWQATGTNWPVPILAASATVRIAPAAAAASDTAGWSPWCYEGAAQSTSNAQCTARFAGRGLYQFTSGRLDPGEGLTFVAAFPKGVIAPPTESEQFAAKAAIWWPLGVPVAGFFALLLLWARHGREPDPGSIVPVWNPPRGLPAGAAGALVNQRAGMNDIVATVIDMAVRGYLTINEVEPEGVLGSLAANSFAAKALHSLGVGTTDWNLIRTAKSLPGDLVAYEQRVMDGLFEDDASARRMSELHNEFYTHLSAIKQGIYTLLIQLGLFRRNPDTTRGWYIASGVVTMILAAFLGIRTSNVVLGVGIGLLAVMLFIFSNFMPAKTAEGARRWREVKGLEEYIRRAEKHELEMTQAPEKTTELFSTLLPYAIALKVSDIWVKQFGDLLRTAPPTWYAGTSPTFNATNFSSGLSSFQTAASHTMASAPGGSSGSGGGGSVGGGGGGGGGGSW